MKRTLLFIACLLASLAMSAQEYYPEGTKWTEIRLDTLKYDSWYSKVGNQWVPNFETIEYYVKGEYTTMYGEKYKCVYTNGPEWTDSLTLGIQEGELIQYNEDDEIIVTAFGRYDDGAYGPYGWASTYQFDWSIGKGIYFKNLLMSMTTYLVQYECYYGIIDKIKEDYFGGVRQLKYVDLNGKAPECGKYDNPQKVDTQGGRIIQGIGITEWNDGECLFGPPDPYSASGGEYQSRHYRSMLVHFERNGEVLYDVWPDSLQTDQEGHTNDSDYIPLVEMGKTWTYSYSNMSGNTYDITRVVDGDTIIGGLAYKKIYDKIGENYQYALREDGKQVYIVHDHYETPQLLYDFSKDKGDIITKEIDEKCGLVSEMRVIGVDTIDIDGLKIRRLQLWQEVYNIQNPVDWERVEVPWQGAFYWIEGVGSECLLETSFREEGNYYNLKSCQINGRTYSQQELLQEPSKPQNDYIPFVEMGKQWHVVSNASYPYSSSRFERYNMFEEVERNGKTYVHTGLCDEVLAIWQDAGLYREENRRVYKYDETAGREFMMYDFSLKAGDTFTYEYGFDQPVNCKVLKQGYLIDGPQIATSSTLVADTLETRYRYLRTWTIGVDNGAGDYNERITWVEGVGTLINMFDYLFMGGRISSLAFVERNNNKIDYQGNNYLPFSFYNMYGLTHGCNLPIGAEDFSEDRRHHLTYELEGNRLHVYGEVFCNCGPNHYAYFIEKPTDDPLVHKIEFVIQDEEPLMWCEGLHTTNFYVPGFDPNMNYIVLDSQGEEHPVINKTPQMTYRPMIEDGKVWKVGAVNSGNPAQWVEYYYFDGDTIIDGKTCKQMMCQRYVNPDFAESNYISQDNALSYVGAWYEEDQKVYAYKDHQFKLMYDFSANAYDTLLIDNGPYVIGPKQTGGIRGFKGVYRAVFPCSGVDSNRSDFWFARWLEGVGSIDGPMTNIIDGQLADPAWFLMSCTVGDEVIYLNDAFEDGATPETSNAPKSRFDFTHIIKTRPKAPKRRGADQSIYGEYNEHQLGINLDPLDEAYLVRITDDKSGKVVYEKAINAGNIVALNIDISTYAKGHYTITVENSLESFTGEFDTIVTGIVEVRNKKIEVRDGIYNLQGQSISYLQKGLNIVNGRKVMVK